MRRRPLGMLSIALLSMGVLSVGVAGCLNYERFLDKKADKYCEELAKCNPDTPCEVPSSLDTGSLDADECNFDAGSARDCLAGTWTCDDRFPGFEYPVPAQACYSVCGVQ